MLVRRFQTVSLPPRQYQTPDEPVISIYPVDEGVGCQERPALSVRLFFAGACLDEHLQVLTFKSVRFFRLLPTASFSAAACAASSWGSRALFLTSRI